MPSVYQNHDTFASKASFANVSPLSLLYVVSFAELDLSFLADVFVSVNLRLVVEADVEVAFDLPLPFVILLSCSVLAAVS